MVATCRLPDGPDTGMRNWCLNGDKGSRAAAVREAASAAIPANIAAVHRLKFVLQQLPFIQQPPMTVTGPYPEQLQLARAVSKLTFQSKRVSNFQHRLADRHQSSYIASW